jgi:hypothetical protein
MASFKSSRLALASVVAIVVVVFGIEAAVLMRDTSRETFYGAKDREVGAMVDRMDFIETADDFAAGSMKQMKLITDSPARIVLHNTREKGFPRQGTWTSPEMKTAFGFTEMVPSWNVNTPANTGVEFTVRARDVATGQWTPWLRIGAWGRVTEKRRHDDCDFGHVDTDTLFLNKPADVYQIRATLQSFDLNNDAVPSIRRITASYSGPVGDGSLWAKQSRPDPGPPQRWARELDIPYIPQGDNADAVTGMTCSPTSLSMVLRYWGVDRPTMENCLAIWDDHNELFGNWSNATQRASELGMDSWLQRFRNWDQVKEMIARGQPVIASIGFEEGSYDDAPIYRQTPGHLIVIRGFKPDGTVIVNDPANRAKGKAALYPPRGLGHAWFGKGGIGYVIHPPAKPLPASLVKYPATMPSTAPVAAHRAAEHRAEHPSANPVASGAR